MALQKFGECGPVAGGRAQRQGTVRLVAFGWLTQGMNDRRGVHRFLNNVPPSRRHRRAGPPP